MGTLFEPMLLAGDRVSDEFVADRAAWVTERGLRMPVYDLRGGPRNVDSVLSLPFTARLIPDSPATRLFPSGRHRAWNLTGDRDIDAGLREGSDAAVRIMLYDPNIHNIADVEQAFRERLHPSRPPTTLREYTELVGLYLNAPRIVRDRFGPLQLLQEPPDAHTTIQGLTARHRATVRALLAAGESLDPLHLDRTNEMVRRYPELAHEDVAIDPRSVDQLRRDLERIENFLHPQGVDDDELNRLLVIDFDPVRGVGLRLWRGEVDSGEARVFVGMPDPAAPGHTERVGQVSAVLLEVLRNHPGVTIAESWNGTDLESTLPTSLFYVHAHVGRPERVFAEGSTGPVASAAYPAETETVPPSWETHLQTRLLTVGQGGPSGGVRQPAKPDKRRGHGR
ncbi:MAG: hypothetical protein DLM55_00850 [Acidimicrobiales bacterium]|nr:MAG: hypothetical protein DLM55_00850 [Acidimicrobiales bacterium]